MTDKTSHTETSSDLKSHKIKNEQLKRHIKYLENIIDELGLPIPTFADIDFTTEKKGKNE